MSPAGIVMFYGAFDRKTAIWETWDFKQTVWIAQFRSLRALRLLDLSQLPGIPSIYDQDHREEIAELAFLHDFVEDLVKPIEQDSREHIDYVPTQVVTEYFRHRFRMKEGEPLDGILYRSSKYRQGVACVLFIGSEHCGVPVDSIHRPEQILELLAGKTEILDPQSALAQICRCD